MYKYDLTLNKQIKVDMPFKPNDLTFTTLAKASEVAELFFTLSKCCKTFD